MKKIAVLLSTYNGEKYLKEQVLSIHDQKFDRNEYSLQILIRDDGSSDNTLSIIKDLESSFSEVQQVVSKKNLGFVGSFMKLLSESKADYYFFSDQDDVWLENKVSLFLKKFREVEMMPSDVVGVFSNAWIADESAISTNKTVLGVRTKRIHNGKLVFNQQLFESYVQGASLAINNNVREKFLKYDLTDLGIGESHDHFLGLIAGTYGNLFYIDKPLINYRQTGHNTIGARPTKQKMLAKVLSLQLRVDEAASLMLAGEYVLSKDPHRESDFIELHLVNESHKGSLKRVKFFYRNRQFVSGKYPKLLSLLFALLMAPIHKKTKFENVRKTIHG